MMTFRLLGFLLVYFIFVVRAGADEVTSSIKIGWIGPLTGPSAVLGIDSVKAAQMAIDNVNKTGGINGSKLELIAEDDQYITAKTVSAYHKLVNSDGIKFLYVVTYGGLFAIADRAKRDGVVIVDPLDCNDRIGALNDHVLCIAKTTESLGTLIADRVIDSGLTPVGVLYFESDPFPKETAEHAVKQLASRGVTPVLFEGYPGGTQDFKALIQRLKSSKVKSLIMYGYDEMGILARQARDLGLRVPLFSFATVTSPGFLQSAQGSAEGITIVNWVGEGGPALEAFLAEFKTKEGRQPFLHISTLPSYDTLVLVAQCLREGAYDKSSAGILSAPLLSCLYKTKDFKGISGTITMSPDGVTRSFNHIYSTLVGTELKSIN